MTEELPPGKDRVDMLDHRIGRNKARKLLDRMTEEGLVEDKNGSRARKALVTPEDWAERRREV